MGGVIPLIDARGLTVGHGRRALVAGIDLTLTPGEVLCLLGPNGVGKTTLFRTLLGLTPALAGAITVAGHPIADLSRARIAAHLALVPQALTTPFAFRALDIVLMGAAARLGPFARPGAAERAQADAALATLGLSDLAETAVTRLSGGQRQLVLIARALAQGARAVLMDEPTASLDFANRLRVEEAIRALAAMGTGVILTTHDPDQAARLGHRALLLGPGGVICCGPVAEVMTEATLARLYGVAVTQERLADGALHHRHAR